jgi:2'-5' RNA ligase
MDMLNRSSIGLKMPPEVQQALADVQVQIRRKAGAELVRWTPPSELCLTMLTLGELTPPTLARIAATIGPIIIRYPALQLGLEGLGGSPTTLQPRFIWAGVSGDLSSLFQLHGELERAVKGVLPEYEPITFEPQVPLGRLKQQSEQDRTALGRAIRVAAVGQIAPLTIEAIELLRYAVTTAGPTLVPVESYRLTG